MIIRACLRRRLLQHLLLFACCSLLGVAARAQFVPFAEVFLPVGVVTDARGNIFISHDNVDATYVTKFNPEGMPLGSVQIGGFFDIGAVGHLARVPSTGALLLLLQDGRLVLINPDNLEARLLLDIRQLNVDVGAIYDVFSGVVSGFGGVIQPSLSTYGDLAVLERPTHTDLFVTGLSQAQAFPFVLHIRLQNGAVTDARVLVSSNAATVTDSLQTPRLPRGIAVNAQGTVLTSLPNALQATGGTSERPFDVLVAFDAAFDPHAGAAGAPRYVLGTRTDIYSQGITADATGRFYVATNASGTAALGRAGEGVLVLVPPTLDRVLAVASLNRPLTSFYDVALSPDAARGYIGVDLFSVGPAADIVMVLELQHVLPTDVADATARPAGLVLEPAYPNPFADRATLHFTPARSETVQIVLYDMLGQYVRQLFEGWVPAGSTQTIQLDGDGLASGAYWIRLQSDTESAGQRVVRLQ